MKLFAFILPFFFQALYAQEPEINAHFSETPIPEVLQILEEQSGYTFSYESSLLDHFKPVTLELQHTLLGNALKQIFGKSDIEYKIMGNHIILKKRPRIYVIHGTVTDDHSKETLINATIYDLHQQIGTVTNSHGGYSLSLPDNSVNLTISFVGYKPWYTHLTLTSDTTISVALEPALNLQEVVVKGEPFSKWIRNLQPGQTSFPIHTVNKLPSLLGESDLLKTIQLLPGVKTGTEGMSGLFVRGGNIDENLYLMDGIPLYNPSHLLGFFSTFNSDAVKNVEFYKSSFPARYGGRLSSIVDVRLKEGNMQEYHGNISIGLISSKFNLEGPIIRDKTAFNISLRRTYADFIASPLIRIFTKHRDDNGNEQSKGGYYFADINAKITHKLSEQSRISLNTFWGHDKLRYNHRNKQHGHLSDPNFNDWSSERQKGRWNWGNLLTALEWNYNISNRLNMNTSIAYNQYMSKIFLKANHKSNEDNHLKYNRDKRKLNSGIHDWIAKSDLIFTLAPRHQIRFGANYIYHTFIPKTNRHIIENNNQSEKPFIGKQSIETKIHSHDFSLYGEDEISLGNKIRLQPGFHFSLFQVEGKTYTSFQPRISFQYTPIEDLSLKLSYTRMNQYIHLLSTGALSMPTDLWVPVTSKISPMASGQISGGIYYELGKKWEFTLEGYYKTMKNLIDYVDGNNILPEYQNWEDGVTTGKGRAYGMEVQCQRIKGKTTGWINYTLSWTNRYFADERINQGKWFPAKFDNRHNVNIAFIHRFNKRFDISANWVFNTGSRITLALERYNSSPILPGGGNNPPNELEYYEHRNNYKLDNYHRLDLGFNFHKQKRRGIRTWSLYLYNSYCKMNPFYVYTDEYHYNGKHYKSIWKSSLFPIIPSFSYTFTF